MDEARPASSPLKARENVQERRVATGPLALRTAATAGVVLGAVLGAPHVTGYSWKCAWPAARVGFCATVKL